MHQTIYARLYTHFADNSWQFVDSTFSAAAAGVLISQITAPANNETDVTPTQQVQWTQIPNAQFYILYLGSSLGAKDIPTQHGLRSGDIVVARERADEREALRSPLDDPQQRLSLQ